MRGIKPALMAATVFLSACGGPAPTGEERGAKVSTGTLETYEDFKATGLTSRDLQVWLPDGYAENAANGHKYAVLYMHDGQMLYDASVTWNSQEWGVDEVAGKLMAEGKVRNFIVVGVFNGGDTRHADYLPEKPYHLLPENVRQGYYGTHAPDLKADEYIAFLADELKPFIDSKYATLTGPEDTAVMGSSMGGLISMYAIGERPDVFGMAACMSTHWPGFDPGKTPEMPDTFIAYMRENLPPPEGHRIYFDYGDQTLDAHYPPLQKRVDAVMTELGYTASNWLTVYDPGANHSEDAWNKRLPGVFMFLFGK
ncbi:alpha/beta hydrolase [Kordiimonas lipolytica]|uniref:Alpha/beta hydrolase n=1 Tax=Kordiimonas lipolytica TaxID=1662421 RepID=A0ABV8UDZ0_9PROT|nr:alpha/beta hydrolase-fold protein [Kordiimonas lipolytica]